MGRIPMTTPLVEMDGDDQVTVDSALADLGRALQRAAIETVESGSHNLTVVYITTF